MPTAVSSTDLRRDLADLRALAAFRNGMVRDGSRRRLNRAMGGLLLMTVAATALPILLPGAGTSSASDDWLHLMPLTYTAFLLLSAGSSIASGGGRELVSRDDAVVFPISAATDHFGALLMAPLNIAWLLQVWLLLGLTTYVAGPVGLLTAPPLVLLWAAFSTAVGQVAGWTMEAVRRGPRGVWAARGLLAALAAAAGLLVASGTGQAVVDALPSRFVIDAALHPGPAWPIVFVVLLAVAGATSLVGVPVARMALRRPARDEQRLVSGHQRAREIPTGPADAWGDLRVLVRVDRAGVFRSLPMRRGLLVLTLLPGVGGFAAGLGWDVLILLPGLIVSGVTLLFGVNAWALEGRGALWRESLPVDPGLAFAARSIMLAQLVLVSAATGTGLAVLRAEPPTTSVVAALLSVLVVVVLQSVAAAMRWSGRSPHTADLSSARAVPAPPMAMLGYSARLALGTTLTGMVFSGLAYVDAWLVSPVVAVPFLAWSGARLLLARRAWCTPAVRSHVVTTVAA